MKYQDLVSAKTDFSGLNLLVLYLSLGFVLQSTVAHAGASPDAFSAATPQSKQPGFSAIVLIGPNVLNGAAVNVGQALQLKVIVSNPWSNNTVSMALANVLPGMTLVQNSTSQSQPSWVLNWTPDSTEIGANNVTFVTTFTQTSGANTGTVQTYQPGLPIKVTAGSGFVSNASAIKSLSITKATFNQRTNVLVVKGQVKLQPGYPLPPSTAVTLSYQSGSSIPDPGATISVTDPRGLWSTTISTLTAGKDPCVIGGLVSVEGVDTTDKAIKKVTPKVASGCTP